MKRPPFVLITSIIFICFVFSSKAQETSTRSRIALGAGLGFAGMSAGNHSNSNLGLSLAGQLGNHFLLMVEANPLRVKNPVMDESFNAFNIILSPSFGKAFRLRPGLGLQSRIWSGSKKVENFDAGPVICLDAGYEFRKSDQTSLVLEFVFRNSLIEIEGSVTSTFIGLQIVALGKNP
jgi:hypothetical protein